MSTKNSPNLDTKNPVLEAVIQTLQSPNGSAFWDWMKEVDEGGFTRRESKWQEYGTFTDWREDLQDYDDYYTDWLDWTEIK